MKRSEEKDTVESTSSGVAVGTRCGSASKVDFSVSRCTDALLAARLPHWTSYVHGHEASPSRDPGWLAVLERGLKHQAYCVEAVAAAKTVGLLPLAYVSSLLFGRFLVSLPYLNTGGVLADNEEIARGLVDRAVALADRLEVRYLELRHEKPLVHPALTHALTSKVHMRLALPPNSKKLWEDFDPKVRNQVRKAEKLGLSVRWGGLELVGDFYRVFARNMRELGTPVFGRRLFESILRQFPQTAEFCLVSHEGQTVAAALLVHGPGVTEVPSASSLRSHNFTNANMLMYWQLLKRAVERGQAVFDFGRSTVESNTFRFKKQWGAQPQPAVWQYYVRKGSVGDLRPESAKYRRLIATWRHLPVWLTRLIGPAIVRGIP